MFVVIDKDGKAIGPFLNWQDAYREQAYSGGHIYLLSGPVKEGGRL